MSEAFMTLYSGLLREGPGDAKSLGCALYGLSNDARIFDAACGSGADTALMLDMLPDAKIIGVDKQPQFIDAANARDLNADFRVADMLEPDGMFDLIWSAGAVYFVGIEAALQAWRPHLKQGGKVGFSELVWLTDNPSGPAKKFWNTEFPAMGTMAGMVARVEAQAFRVTSAEPLGLAGWQGYVGSLKTRIKQIRTDEVSEAMQAVLFETETELALFDTYSGEFDYAVFMAEPV